MFYLEGFDWSLFSCVLKVMMVVGGQAPKAIRSVECYDFEEGRWFQVAELPSRRCRAGELHAHIIDNDWQNDSPWSHIQQLCMLEQNWK